ncbi:MotA/TolQ/ExbB proton channel family protein [Candidatus Anaplasma sp. TIGMIC]|uniref:MotA/TolQ/ExbB proton channel family protein n=1 Tax=Candidatus Anaplasma sp. TIGMIC TaxID=3020713 RepID=UPI00232BA15B|nr:MotA/TolQ/ExbB proton channel family protein [Candidatus Anaplasma sp. TIGMIC]MDB1135055.1 MotA/TolQ/ExbB proton channel family protein [Candidatus Anaplasma sp. TIGMIC]
MSVDYVHEGISVLGVFAESGIVVKLVMLVLVSLSIASWAVIFKKHLSFAKHKQELRDLEILFSTQGMSTNLHEVVECSDGVVSSILQHGIRNTRLVQNKKEGFHRFVGAALSRAVGKLEEHLELLATVGSSSPLVGLLGAIWKTVEGLRSLQATGASVEMASLGPDIAEALYVTALALVVAIPANAFYSKFSADVTKISNRLGNLVCELSTFIADNECRS